MPEPDELERAKSVIANFPEARAVHSFITELGLAQNHYPISSKGDLLKKVGGPDKVLNLMGESIPIGEIIRYMPANYFPIVDENNLIEKATHFYKSLPKDPSGVPRRPIKPAPIRSEGSGRRITAIVKPTHECNLSCRYCYLPEVVEKGEMDKKTLENTIKKVTKFNGKKVETYFIWHGGEALLMGLEFFEKIVEIENLLRKKGYRIKNGVQSNGTLVDDTFLDFCEQQKDFRIGLSLDGPKQIHDATRPYKENGNSSFDDVYRAVKLIQKRNEKLRMDGKNEKLGGGVICILNKLNIGQVEELYKFFHRENIWVKLNPLIRSGRALNGYDEISITAREYGEAMIKLFDIWFYDPNQRISINPFAQIMGNIMTKVPSGCGYGESCQKHFISIGPTGAVYPCGRYESLTEYYLGNINTDSMEEIDTRPIREKLKQRGYEKVKGCNLCEYKEICNSGCMHNAYMVSGNSWDKDYYCIGNKMIFKHIGEILHRELKKGEVKANSMVNENIIEVLGYRVNLQNVTNPALRSVIRGHCQVVVC